MTSKPWIDFLGILNGEQLLGKIQMTETTFRSVSEQFLLFGKASTTFVHCSCEGSVLADEEIFEDHHLKPKVLTLSSFNDLKLDGLFIVPL